MGLIKKLFKKKHPLQTLAEKGNYSEFCHELLQSDILVLSDHLGEALPFDAPDNEFLRITETAAKQEPDKLSIFTFTEDGTKCLPFFLSIPDAEAFCGAFSGREDKIFAYQFYGVSGSILSDYLTKCDEIIMNAQSEDEFTLNNDILLVIKKQKTKSRRESIIKQKTVILPQVF